MIIYLDESGDTGWNFSKEYRHGGSSRYLTIASLIVPKNKKHFPKRMMKNFREKIELPASKEAKGSSLRSEERNIFSGLALSLLANHQDISLSAITVKKQNVAPHIQADPNKIYNYMIGLFLLEQIKSYSEVTIIPDPRTIKVKSGNSLIDYLQTKLWFEMNSATTIHKKDVMSCNCANLQFIDIVTNINWRHYEDGECKDKCRDLKRKTNSRELYFH